MVDPSPNDILYFCDESSQSTDEFAAVAGLAIHRKNIAKVTTDLAAIKAASGKTGEVKWKNAKSYGARVHTAYVDYLFLLIEERKAQFHIRFSEMSDYDHNLSGERRRIDTVSKAFYQLFLHRACRHYRKHPIFIHPDDGEYTSELPKYLGALNYQALAKFGGLSFGCVQTIQPRSSEREPMLQLLDVPLGALAALRNNRTKRPGYSEVKAKLADYTLAKTGWPSVLGSCPIDKASINRWNARPSL